MRSRRSFSLNLALLFLLWAAAAGAQEKSWEREWNETVVAARKEGKVVVVTSPDPVMRDEIVPRFKARFGITVEHVPGRSSQTAARVRTERQSGIYTVDLFMAGIQTMATVLHREKMVDALRPALILPEIVAAANWKAGKFWFMDPEDRYVLRLFNTVGGNIHINTDYIKPEEMRSARDLLNVKWKGKISTEDPTVPGSGSNPARFYLQFGEEFVKRLYIEQKPAFSRDQRQLTDWLARGVYPICLNCDVERIQKEGFPIKDIFLSDIPATVTAAPWLLALANRAPHPHAARVFINWLASKEALEIYSRGRGNATLRSDVDESFLPPQAIPRPGLNYFDTSNWSFNVNEKEKIRLRLEELLRSREG